MQMISWARRMAFHPKASGEFQNALQSIQPIMTDPDASREYKRETLNMMVSELSEDTFKLKPIAEQILTIINMKEEVCKGYPNSEAQTNGILEWLPRFKQHQDLLLEEVKNHRKQFKLLI